MKHLVRLVSASLAFYLSLVAPALANDKFTGVPVYPGVADSQPATHNLTCPGNFHMRVSLYVRN